VLLTKISIHYFIAVIDLGFKGNKKMADYFLLLTKNAPKTDIFRAFLIFYQPTLNYFLVRSFAAFNNPTNKGCGFIGRDKNSG
jgi:hypothetical protein